MSYIPRRELGMSSQSSPVREEINSDFLDADFCPGITSGLPVIREEHTLSLVRGLAGCGKNELNPQPAP